MTVGQYWAFIEAGGYQTDRWWAHSGLQARVHGFEMVIVEQVCVATGVPWTQPRFWDNAKWTGDADLPVVNVSWYEAYAYTRWLAEVTNRPYRLLTESEWEKAARGGREIPDRRGGMQENPETARIWLWGNEEPTEELCNFNNNYRGGRTSLVTSHEAQARAQPYGLYHMTGNTWEWCLSKLKPYNYEYPEDNDPEANTMRVLRGGGWQERVVRADVGDKLNTGGLRGE